MNSARLKILILNVGWSNKGNRAIVDSTMETIKKFAPGAEFYLMGACEEDYNGFKIKKQVGYGLSIKKPHRTILSLLYLIKCVLIHIFKRFNMHIHISQNSRLFDYYSSDIVINSGGDHLSGENGIGTLSSFINISYAILLDKPVVLYGESLGYFSNPVVYNIAKFVLNRTTLILLREGLSKEYLEKKGIIKPKIYVTAEPAFALSAAPKSRIYEILSDAGISGIQRPLIGINPSGLIITDENKIDALARVIDDLVENLGATIIMIPHVYSGSDDDRIAISKINYKVKNKLKVKIIKNEYTPQELKGIIGQCDLFIAARMHATIASTSMLVPTVGIAYSHKMHGIIGEMLGQEKYVLDIKELDYESLISTINDAWENREEIKKELEVKIPMIKEKAMLNGKLVKELLDSLNNPK